MKRIKRKQLKEDEFVTTVNKIMRFLQKRTKEIVAFVVLILFAILVFIRIRLIKAHQSENESQVLAQIFSLGSELNNNPENVEKLEELAGSGRFSRVACVVLATHWVGKGELEKAKASLEKMNKSPKDIFYYQAQDLLAQILSKQKNYDKAIEIYTKIEEENPEEYSLAVILFHRAEVLEEKGETEEALAFYKRVQEEFPQSYYSLDASKKIRELEVKK